jgi:N-acetylmuramoyl-L-alanine amidase
VIKTGDYFSKLAKEWGCTIADIEAANPGVDSRRLQVGQKLVVPKPR